jgi:outer membrane lipoprotein LolB
VAVGNQGFDAGLRWSQAGEVTRLTLSGPLGAGGVRVTARSDTLSVITSSGRRLGNAAAREALVDQLGFEPPISSLRYWVLGVPDPAASAQVTLGGGQRPESIQQSGWRIEYRSYTAVGAEWLPRLLTLRHAGVRVRMLVTQWQL